MWILGLKGLKKIQGVSVHTCVSEIMSMILYEKRYVRSFPIISVTLSIKEIVIYTAWAVFLQILRDIAFVFLFLANPVLV